MSHKPDESDNEDQEKDDKASHDEAIEKDDKNCTEAAVPMDTSTDKESESKDNEITSPKEDLRSPPSPVSATRNETPPPPPARQGKIKLKIKLGKDRTGEVVSPPDLEPEAESDAGFHGFKDTEIPDFVYNREAI